ncbi:hypothetical protein NXS19_002811 [Fusarium pseudograminearum]|nr:hypothetical protein NXS19_002811 [Fusarium pseudograminearum]
MIEATLEFPAIPDENESRESLGGEETPQFPTYTEGAEGIRIYFRHGRGFAKETFCRILENADCAVRHCRIDQTGKKRSYL